MKRLAIAAALLAGLTAGAGADEKMNAMSHIGQVMGGTLICPRVEAATGMLSLLMMTYGIDLKDPATAAFIEAKAREAKAAWAGKDEDAACAAVLLLYGPNGANVPGLWREK